jgi:outer membrane receptor protein involved in Fe transport
MKLYIYNVLILTLLTVSLKAQKYTVAPDTSVYLVGELSEIVIKASKDNVTFKSLPASVTVISETLIAGNEIKSLNGATASIPNFFMPDYGSKLTSPVYIRGIGSRINSPSVGLYVDHVPYFEKASFSFDFFDIKRIEVLRGPQGTLFGRNTMGGIVNIITTSPLDYTGSNISLTAATYGKWSVTGGHYSQVNDRLVWSAALNFLHNDGFHTNAYSGERVDKLNSWGARNRIIYELTPRLTLENIAGGEISRQGGYPYAIYNSETGNAGDINYNQESIYNRNMFSDALLASYSGTRFDISATTSYQYLDDLQGIDQDFTPDSLYYINQEQKQNMISQEVIARSKQTQKYRWLFGGYAFHQSFDNAVDVDAWKQKMNYLKTYDHKISGFALFHQSTLTDFLIRGLTVTAGLRLDTERDFLDYTYDRTLNGMYALLADTVYPALKSLEIIPRFALTYKFNNKSIYAVAARGYKTGGFNSTFERPEDLTFEPEFSWNYEIGIKTPLVSNMLYADLALFYIDWRNQQIYQTVPSGRGSMLKNAGHSVSKGAEVSLRASLNKGYELNVAYGYTHATFISHVVNAELNYNGNLLPYVPRHTFSANASKNFSIRNSKVLDNIRVNLLYRANGDIFWDEENEHKQPFYGLADAKVSFIRGSLHFDLWCKNMFNTDYAAFYFEALGNRYMQPGKPAQAGMNLSIKF